METSSVEDDLPAWPRRLGSDPVPRRRHSRGAREARPRTR